MIRRTFRCRHCRRNRPRNPRVKDQEYCGDLACQNARKNEWRKKKRQSDAAYRESVRESQKQWREKNPDYWKNYRDEHSPKAADKRPAHTHANKPSRAASRAKSDALDAFFLEDIRRCEIRRVEFNAPVKSDALIVEIVPLSPG